MTKARSAAWGTCVPTSMVAGLAFEGVEVLGEGLPVPAQPLVQSGAGDVLDTLHHLDQPVVAVRAPPVRSPTPQLPMATVVTP